jgi:hypothetical protein
MSAIIDFTAERQARVEPDPDCVTADPDRRPMQIYALDYRLGGRVLTLTIDAYSFEDAEARVAAMRESLVLVGQVVARGEL